MVDAASDPKNFRYISSCMPGLKPVIGDARLTFAKEPDGVYDLIIVDAYSSDAIPIHLATEEAMDIYKDKLAPHGAVVMHVSNRHLDLETVVVGIAALPHVRARPVARGGGVPGRDRGFAVPSCSSPHRRSR